WLEDLGSRNGTLLNGAPLVETAVISAGDVITIGGTDLKVEL
nr:FHA domain-containing protein [Chloroflexota bacterium]